MLVSLSLVSDSATPWTAARQASLSFPISRSLLTLMSIALEMLSNGLCIIRDGKGSGNNTRHARRVLADVGGRGASMAWNPSLGSIQGPQGGPLCTSTLPVSFAAACLKRAPVSMDKSHPRDGGRSEPSSSGRGLCLPGAEQTWGHVTAARETCVFPASWQARPS